MTCPLCQTPKVKRVEYWARGKTQRVKRFKEEYHIKCHDCGRFLKKGRWVKKDHPWKKHGLCDDCFSNYDSPEY